MIARSSNGSLTAFVRTPLHSTRSLPPSPRAAPGTLTLGRLRSKHWLAGPPRHASQSQMCPAIASPRCFLQGAHFRIQASHLGSLAKSVPDPVLARDGMLQDASALNLDVVWTSRGKHMADANQNDISESIARGWGIKVSR